MEEITYVFFGYLIAWAGRRTGVREGMNAAAKAKEEMRVATHEHVRRVYELQNQIQTLRGQLIMQRSSKDQFTQTELKTLLQLCHPDKHGGKKSANDITVKILDLVA